MNYYLIDLENVQSRGLIGADLLGPSDCIVIFYSPSVKSVTELAKERILRGEASVIVRSVKVRTKDALDFELSLYAGTLIAGGHPDRVFIISEDNGYKAALEAGNREMRLSGSKGKTFFQCRSLLEAWYQKERAFAFNGQDKPFPVKDLKDLKRAHTFSAADTALRHAVSAEMLDGIIRQADGSRAALYRSLLHTFGRTKGLNVYRELKEGEMPAESKGDGA